MIGPRQYTVHELNELREVVRSKYLFGSYRLPGMGGSSRSYREDEMAKVVEEEVRTHMLAGHTADDLRASELVAENIHEQNDAQKEVKP